MRPRRHLAVFVATLAALVVAMAGAAAHGQTAGATASIASVGWWTDRPLAQPVGDGTIEVARTLDGTSVAAVSIRVGAAVTRATLTLQEEGGVRPVEARLLACAGPPFEPADPGPLDAAPATECAGSIELRRSADGTWSADIASVLTVGTTAVAIVPAPAAADASPVDPGFSVQLSGATVDAVPSGAPSSTETGDGGVPPTVPATSPPSPTLDFSSPPPGSGFVAPDVAAPVPDTGMPTTIAPPVDSFTAEDREVAGAPLATGPISGGSGDAKPWLRLLVLLPLSGAAGAGAIYGRRILDSRAALG